MSTSASCSGLVAKFMSPDTLTIARWSGSPEPVSQHEFLALAGGGHRHLGEELDSLRNLPDGQLALVGQVVPQFGEGDVDRASRHDRRARPLAGHGVRNADDGNVRDLGVGQQGLLHLPRADVEPATDDDVLDPPGDPEVSVLVEPADIPGSPPAFIVGGLRGEIRSAPVLEQSPRTAVPDLAGRTGRGRPTVLTDDPDLDAGNRPA